MQRYHRRPTMDTCSPKIGVPTPFIPQKCMLSGSTVGFLATAGLLVLTCLLTYIHLTTFMQHSAEKSPKMKKNVSLYLREQSRSKPCKTELSLYSHVPRWRECYLFTARPNASKPMHSYARPAGHTIIRLRMQ